MWKRKKWSPDVPNTKSMRQQYIVEPSVEVARKCSANGIFLEDDYYIAMSHHEVPDSFWKNVDKVKPAGKKVVIVAAYESPMLITKSAFLAMNLAKPDKITVKVSGKDESILLNEMFEQSESKLGCDYSVYQSRHDELSSNGAWVQDLNEATDVVVFGGLDTISLFNLKTTDERSVHLHRPKISFGVVSKECLENEDNLAGLVGDFISCFGEGTLAPKFYITLGKLSNDQLTYIADCIKGEEDLINEFRAKLPLSKRMMLMNDITRNNYLYPHVRNSKFDSAEFLSPLYGDVRLIEVKSEDQVMDFVDEYCQIVSSVALEEENLGNMAAEWGLDDVRFCDVGSLQFPYFYESYDEVDEFVIYNS